MAAPAFSGTVTQLAGGFRSGAQNVPVPSSGANAANDVVIIGVYKETLGATITSTNFVKPSDASAGFNEIAASASHSWYIGWKRLTANDSGNYSVDVGGDNSWTEAIAVKITGAITTGNIWDFVVGLASAGNVTVSPPVSGTTTGVDRLLVLFATNFNGGSWTPASGLTERFDGATAVTANTGAQAVAGATGNKSATCSTTGRSITWMGGIKPIASGSNVPGTIATTFGHSFTASGSGRRPGTINTTFVFSATGSGTGRRPGSINTTFAFTATASGTSVTPGTIATTFVFAATAVGGELPIPGTISTTFVFTGTASGSGKRPGSISTTFAFAATASGTSVTPGTINTVFPFTATAVGTGQSNETGTISTTFVFNATAIGTAEGQFVPDYDIPGRTRSSRALILTTDNPVLDLADWIGQRTGTFIFRRVHGITGEDLGPLNPLRSPAPSLTHDTTRTIKRQLSLALGVVDARNIEPLYERVTVAMLINGVEYPLGRYVYSDANQLNYASAGNLGSVTLLDEMFVVDQELDKSFSASTSFGAQTALQSIRKLLKDQPIKLKYDSSEYVATGAWNAGSTRGQVIDALITQGDYFSPWFGNDEAMHFIRTFDPALSVPTFNWDEGKTVFLGSVVETNDLLVAPNRFVVISNSGDADVGEIVGTYDVPASAPHSIANRGFIIPSVQDMQLTSTAQAIAVAKSLGIRQTVFERREITTAIDPRHDSYDVVRWAGENWLELAWSMTLAEGEGMSHILRKAYR